MFVGSAPITGKVYYVNPAGEIREVADDIHYANGLVLTPVVPDPCIDNVAVGDDGKLYISAVRDESASPWPGAIYRVDNSVRAAGL